MSEATTTGAGADNGAQGTALAGEDEQTTQGSESEQGSGEGAQGTEEGGEEVVELEIKSITRDKDGNFVFQTIPGDPKSMVYKGKTVDELLGNIAKNVTDKDEHIAKLKAAKPTAGPSAFRNKRVAGESLPGSSEDVKFPDRGELFRTALAEARIDPRFLSFTKEEWKEYEAENGASAAFEIKQAIKEVTNTTNQRFSEESTQAVNYQSLLEETDAVTEMMVEAEVDDSELDFEEVLQDIYKDPKNFMKNGLRRNGRIVAAAAKRIREIVLKRETAKVQKTTDETIATARETKGVVKGAAHAAGPAPKKPVVAAPKTTEDALNAALKAYRVKNKT